MSARLRNILLAFGVSLAMWAAAIQGTLSIYGVVAGPGTDGLATASIR
jgi:uncharacterized membrane protein